MCLHRTRRVHISIGPAQPWLCGAYSLVKGESYSNHQRTGEFQMVLHARLSREDLSGIVTFEQNLNDEMEPTVKRFKGRAF